MHPPQIRGVASVGPPPLLGEKLAMEKLFFVL
jgi:hypothetical protein